ncbi:MAG: hypothetical protein U1E87_11125 [Alphaproteobacteria bacterium]
MLGFLRLLPMTLVVVILYNLSVFFGVAFGGDGFKDATTGAPDMVKLLAGRLFDIPLASGAPWHFTVGAMFVTLGLFALFVELLRSTRTDSLSIANHALSVMVFILCLLEFVVVKGFNTSEFFYLTVMSAIDVIAGFTITIIGSRRDFGGHGLAV